MNWECKCEPDRDRESCTNCTAFIGLMCTVLFLIIYTIVKVIES